VANRLTLHDRPDVLFHVNGIPRLEFSFR
jgi:hypothetical protein